MTARTFQRGDMVTVGKGRRPSFRYLRPVENEPRMAWLEIPFTGRVFKFPALLLATDERGAAT